MENSADIEEKQQLEELMRRDLEQITLKSVPLKLVSNPKKSPEDSGSSKQKNYKKGKLPEVSKISN